MTEMAEALAAIETQVKLAPAKMPEGKILVGICLERDEARSGRYTEAISRNWQTTGWAIALRDGHVVAGNPLFGRWTGGAPKVSAMHWCVCGQCGKQVPMPLAVWQAKDLARKGGVEIPKEAHGIDVLRRYGTCGCGGKWRIDDDYEKSSLANFAESTLKTFSMQESVSPLLPPAAFLVGGQPEQLSAEWQWMQDALSRAGQTVAPFRKDAPGSTMLYNPGMWLGYCDTTDDTDLFWVEGGKAKGHGQFNPAGIEGL